MANSGKGYFIVPGTNQQVSAQLTPEQTYAYLQQLTPEQRPAFLEATRKIRGDNFVDSIEGLDEIGLGSGLSRETRAGGLYGNNITDAEQIEALVSDNPEDYAYDAEKAQGAGYQLVDQVRGYRKFDPLQHEEQENAINQTRTDSTGVNAQRDVLGEYAKLYSQGGLSAIDRARMAEARQQRTTQNRGDQLALSQQFERMGRGGGNAERLSRLQSLQGSQQALAMDDLQTESLALQRRDALLRDRGSLGGQVQTAQDAIDAFNTLGERDRIKTNIDRRNDATDTNFAETNLRSRKFTDTQNDALDTQFDADTRRDQSNTDSENERRRFNVGPNQGSRGMTRDRAAARSDVGRARITAAEHLKGIQSKDDAAYAADIAAKASLAGDAGGFVVDAIGSGGDEEEEDE